MIDVRGYADRVWSLLNKFMHGLRGFREHCANDVEIGVKFGVDVVCMGQLSGLSAHAQRGPAERNKSTSKVRFSLFLTFIATSWEQCSLPLPGRR
jgi:hypothetical protein